MKREENRALFVRCASSWEPLVAIEPYTRCSVADSYIGLVNCAVLTISNFPFPNTKNGSTFDL